MLRWLLSLVLLAASPAAAQIPHFKDDRLIVDGKPFLILGGELGNSSASNREWLRPKWQRMKDAHLNTVLAPVNWELIEPEEGRFDFSSVDWLIEDARAHDMRLVLLWFGAWKNSMSTYTPAWVKRDRKRFPSTVDADGKAQEILSVFGAATRESDARAFGALMRHLKQVDGDRHTVIMVQVENEIGFLSTAREHGAAADAAFAKWKGGEEEFTAHHYARFVEALAAAGKREYALPLFVNGAQGRPGKKPGEYPSGGPLAHLMQIWRKQAPSIDFIAPDIYFPNFAEIARGYQTKGNPFFIPEANNAGDKRAAANALHAIGALGAFGFSPFSIENLPEGDMLGSLYAVLDGLTPSLFAAKGKAGFATPVTFDNIVDEAPQASVLGAYRFTVNFIDPWTAKDKQVPAEHGGILLWIGGDDYLVAGGGITVTVEPADGKGKAGLELVEEGSFVDGRWVPGRRLNGDQTHQGRHIRLPPGSHSVQRVRIYRYG
ncbi:DUF5597 domain-containing protein [Sphingomonas soli]|uniref:DUF5597 domain-containing protein n=1 Tax=Sphingomonas soli TaxID=266127 RepID=UPI000834BEBC|nr:DUF5597 domain-containing protein [Sphingomonas soli]